MKYDFKDLIRTALGKGAPGEKRTVYDKDINNAIKKIMCRVFEENYLNGKNYIDIVMQNKDGVDKFINELNNHVNEFNEVLAEYDTSSLVTYRDTIKSNDFFTKIAFQPVVFDFVDMLKKGQARMLEMEIASNEYEYQLSSGLVYLSDEIPSKALGTNFINMVEHNDAMKEVWEKDKARLHKKYAYTEDTKSPIIATNMYKDYLTAISSNPKGDTTYVDSIINNMAVSVPKEDLDELEREAEIMSLLNSNKLLKVNVDMTNEDLEYISYEAVERAMFSYGEKPIPESAVNYLMRRTKQDRPELIKHVFDKYFDDNYEPEEKADAVKGEFKNFVDKYGYSLGNKIDYKLFEPYLTKEEFNKCVMAHEVEVLKETGNFTSPNLRMPAEDIDEICYTAIGDAIMSYGDIEIPNAAFERLRDRTNLEDVTIKQIAFDKYFENKYPNTDEKNAAIKNLFYDLVRNPNPNPILGNRIDYNVFNPYISQEEKIQVLQTAMHKLVTGRLEENELPIQRIRFNEALPEDIYQSELKIGFREYITGTKATVLSMRYFNNLPDPDKKEVYLEAALKYYKCFEMPRFDEEELDACPLLTQDDKNNCKLQALMDYLTNDDVPIDDTVNVPAMAGMANEYINYLPSALSANVIADKVVESYKKVFNYKTVSNEELEAYKTASPTTKVAMEYARKSDPANKDNIKAGLRLLRVLNDVHKSRNVFTRIFGFLGWNSAVARENRVIAEIKDNLINKRGVSTNQVEAILNGDIDRAAAYDLIDETITIFPTPEQAQEARNAEYENAMRQAYAQEQQAQADLARENVQPVQAVNNNPEVANNNPEVANNNPEVVNINEIEEVQNNNNQPQIEQIEINIDENVINNNQANDSFGADLPNEIHEESYRNVINEDIGIRSSDFEIPKTNEELDADFVSDIEDLVK